MDYLASLNLPPTSLCAAISAALHLHADLPVSPNGTRLLAPHNPVLPVNQHVPVRELFCYGCRMKRRFFNSVESVGQAVREARREQGLTQGELASKAEVGRRFIVDLEAGHLRAELGKVLTVLETLGIHVVALPSVRPSQRLDDIDLDEVMKRLD